MEIEIIKQEKNEIEVKVNNVTIAEVLRVYLDNQGVDFVAWRREHPTEPAILRVESKSKTVKKEIDDAILAIKKDLDKVVKGVKK